MKLNAIVLLKQKRPMLVILNRKSPDYNIMDLKGLTDDQGQVLGLYKI